MKQLMIISCLLLIVNVSNAQYNQLKLEKMNKNERPIILREGNDFLYEKYFNNSSYCIFKVYDGKTLKIRLKRLSVEPTRIDLGKEYRYDSNATLIKTIDHDKGWDFSYEDVINYLYDNIEDKISLETLSISKESFKGRNYWEIETNISFWENDHFLRIDGNTGEVLCHIIIYEEEGGSYTKVLKSL